MLDTPTIGQLLVKVDVCGSDRAGVIVKTEPLDCGEAGYSSETEAVKPKTELEWSTDTELSPNLLEPVPAGQTTDTESSVNQSEPVPAGQSTDMESSVNQSELVPASQSTDVTHESQLDRVLAGQSVKSEPVEGYGMHTERGGCRNAVTPTCVKVEPGVEK